MLYRLLKKVNHSSSTVFSLSSKSYHSGTQSSGLRDEVARAREGSFPAKTKWKLSRQWLCAGARDPAITAKLTAVLTGWAVGGVARHVEDGALDGDESWTVGVGACGRCDEADELGVLLVERDRGCRGGSTYRRTWPVLPGRLGRPLAGPAGRAPWARSAWARVRVRPL